MKLKTRVDLYNIEETFTRPVLVSLVKDIKNILSIAPDTYTIFDVKDAIIKEKTKSGEVEGYNTLKSESILVSYEENMMDGEEIYKDGMFDNDMSIFRDNDIKCYIRPLFHNRMLTISIKYKTKFKNRIFGLISRLKMMPCNQELYNFHNVNYSYILPVHVNRWLKMIYKLKTKRPQDKVTLEEYISSTFDARLEYLNRADGVPKSRLAIRETQLGVYGLCMSDLYNIKSDYDEGQKEWSVDLEYNFLLEKPVSLIIEYPIMIYNTIIPKAYRSFVNTGKDKIRGPYNYLAKHDDRRFQKGRELWEVDSDAYYLCIPKEDQPDIPENLYYNYVLSVLCSIDENDKRFLFNITKLGKVKFDSKVIMYMLLNHKYMDDDEKSLFSLKLFKNNKITHKAIHMKENGDVVSNYDLDYKDEHRVVVCFNKNFNKFKEKDKERIEYSLKISSYLENASEGADELEKYNALNNKLGKTIRSDSIDKLVKIDVFNDLRDGLSLNDSLDKSLGGSTANDIKWLKPFERGNEKIPTSTLDITSKDKINEPNESILSFKITDRHVIQELSERVKFFKKNNIEKSRSFTLNFFNVRISK